MSLKKIIVGKNRTRFRSALKYPVDSDWLEGSDSSLDEEYIRVKSRVKVKKFNNKESDLQSSKQPDKPSPTLKEPRKISRLLNNWCITQLSSSTYTFKWSVQNISLFCIKKGDNLSSPEFKIPQFPNISWKLLLKSNGRKENCIDSYKIALQCSARKPLDVDFKLMLLNSSGTQVISVLDARICNEPLSNSDSFGIKRGVNLIPDLEDDVLTILCSMFAHEKIFHNSSEDNAYDSQLLENKLQVSSYLFELTKDKDFCDVIFCVGNEEFRAHKAILVARSSFFQAMFNYYGNEVIKKYSINNVKPSVFEELLSFIYTGKILNIENLNCDLFEAADTFNLPDLKTMCERYLIRNLSLGNVLQNLILADKLKASDLKEEAKNLIAASSAQLANSSNFKMIKNLNSNLYQEIVCLLLDVA